MGLNLSKLTHGVSEFTRISCRIPDASPGALVLILFSPRVSLNFLPDFRSGIDGQQRGGDIKSIYQLTVHSISGEECDLISVKL